MTGRARGMGNLGAAAGPSGSRRLSKGQRRVLTILSRIPSARDQFVVAMDDISSTFELAALVAAADSPDPRERNKVDTLERGTEKLINWMWELASRSLGEGARLGVTKAVKGTDPMQRLVDTGVISQAVCDRLSEAKATRNDLAHAYPPNNYHAIHDAANIVNQELDGFVTKLSTWAEANGIIPPSPPIPTVPPASP